MRDSNYIYLSAKIKALEPNILDKTDIDRMINSPDLASAFQVLDNTDYGSYLLGVKPENYREALADDLRQLNEFMQKNIPDYKLFKLIMLPRDIINLKFLFKAKLFEINVDKHIENNSAYRRGRLKDLAFKNHLNSPESMRAYLKEQKGQSLDDDIKKIIRDTLKAINKKTRPDDIDSLLTQHYYCLSLTLAKKIDSRFIADYITISIDAANLLIFLRARRLKLSKERLGTKLIKGGNLGTRRIMDYYPDEIVGLKPFVNKNFDIKTAEAYKEFCEKPKIFKMERALENYKVSFAREARRKTYGPELIFSYYLAKLNANVNIAIILTGKLNRVPIEELKKTVREPI